ncbi:MAG: hypothetical protein ACI4SQ_01735 [Eubacterium sp.]
MFILCQGDLAKEPYIIPISEVPVYSLEELCYYMYHNIYTVTEEFFDENLVQWLRAQVHLRTLAMKMEKLIRKHHNIKDLVVTLLCACDYYKKEEIFSLVEVMEKISNLPPAKKAWMKADNCLKAGKYGRSLREYKQLLHGPLAKEISTEEYGDVLHDQAIALFHVSSFRQAADGFKEAYARNHRKDSQDQYFYVLLCMGDKETFEKECEAAGKTQEEKQALLEAWEKACNMEEVVSDEMLVNRSMNDIKDSLIELPQK